ncbi:MAG: MarR family transcriptional regulator [Candidatus Glassbacteria bacterium]
MHPLRILSPIHKATRQISLYLEKSCTELGVSTLEGHALTYLLSYGPCSIGELNRVFGLKRSTMTSLLDRLEKRGLISRDNNPADRRSWVVGTLPEGRRTAEKLRRVLEKFEREVVEGVTRADMESFGRVMESVARVTAVDVRGKK